MKLVQGMRGFSSFAGCQGQSREHLSPVFLPAGRLTFAGKSEGFDKLDLRLKPPEGFFISQGSVGDCQLLAPIYAISCHPAGLQLIDRMIEKLPNGDYKVTFPGKPWKPVLVYKEELVHEFIRDAQKQPELPFPDMRPLTPEEIMKRRLEDGDLPQHVTGDERVRILELAYARLQKKLYPKKYRDITDDKVLLIFDHPNYHYNYERTLKDLTGWRVKSRQPVTSQFLDELDVPMSPGGSRNQILLATTRSPSGDSDYLDPGGMISKYHIWALDGVDSARKTVRVRDPHNTRIALELTYKDFLDYFVRIAWAETPSPTEGILARIRRKR